MSAACFRKIRMMSSLPLGLSERWRVEEESRAVAQRRCGARVDHGSEGRWQRAGRLDGQLYPSGCPYLLCACHMSITAWQARGPTHSRRLNDTSLCHPLDGLQ